MATNVGWAGNPATIHLPPLSCFCHLRNAALSPFPHPYFPSLRVPISNLCHCSAFLPLPHPNQRFELKKYIFLNIYWNCISNQKYYFFLFVLCQSGKPCNIHTLQRLVGSSPNTEKWPGQFFLHFFCLPHFPTYLHSISSRFFLLLHFLTIRRGKLPYTTGSFMSSPSDYCIYQSLYLLTLLKQTVY